MSFNEKAPFLVQYGPYIASIFGGYLLFKAADRFCSQKSSIDTALKVGKSEQKVHFAAGASCGPEDEDNYVFQDKSANFESEEGDGDFDHEAGFQHIPYRPRSYSSQEMLSRSSDFYQLMNQRRSCRFFSDKTVDIEVVKNIIHTAG